MSLPDLDTDAGQRAEPLPMTVERALADELWIGWWVDAPCGSADPDAWFPRLNTLTAVLRTCQACPLRRPCLAAALVGNEHGIWGGTDHEHRQAARRRLADGQPVARVLDDVLHAAYVSEPIRAAA